MRMLGLIVVLATVWMWLRYRVEKKRRLVFAGRPKSSFDEWYAQHYQTAGIPREVVEEVAGSLAKEIGIDVTQLRPEDRFDRELSCESKSYLLNDSLEVFWVDLERVAERHGCRLPDSWEQIVTLDDAIMAMAAPAAS